MKATPLRSRLFVLDQARLLISRFDLDQLLGRGLDNRFLAPGPSQLDGFGLGDRLHGLRAVGFHHLQSCARKQLFWIYARRLDPRRCDGARLFHPGRFLADLRLHHRRC